MLFLTCSYGIVARKRLHVQSDFICLVSINIQQALMNGSGCIFFSIFSDIPLLQVPFCQAAPLLPNHQHSPLLSWASIIK